MKTAFIIIRKTNQDSGLDETLESIKKNNGTPVYIGYNVDEEVEEERRQINELIKAQSLDSSFTHVCMIPEGSSLSNNYSEIMQAYAKDENAIYMPIVSYFFPNEEGGEEIFKGFLNSCLWKPQLVEETGVLPLNLALRQVDTTLYGALIPVSILKENKFDEEIEYFFHFEFITRVLKSKKEFLGVPKALFTLTKDYELKSVDKDEKIKYFEMAREKYLPKKEVAS